jgi:DNA-directed RNA polymerase subunit M/transcription elongation factor TFIIS
MKKTKIKSCRKCKQKLRIPQDIGGMVLVCPSCGQKYYTDFKLGIRQSTSSQDRVTLSSQGTKPKKTLFQTIAHFFTKFSAL